MSNNEKAARNVLQDAIAKQERLYASSLDRLREIASAQSENEVHEITVALREAVELVRCLRRLVAGRSVREIHQAFGAPGDFGYENPVGMALDKTYRGVDE